MPKNSKFVFSEEDFKVSVQEFGETLPDLLLKHQQIAKYALEIEQLDLKNKLDMRFTVGIAGRMNAGKTTLVNTLTGTELPVAITKATATINWVVYNEKNLDKFSVNWCDGTTSELEMHEIKGWTGNAPEVAANVQKTKSLEFYSNTAFLCQVTIVDTPGLDDPKTKQTEKSDEFRIISREAAAIIYVMEYVQTRTDQDFLRHVAKETRLPGASPYNSIGVISKWDKLDVEDPAAYIKKKCKSLREQCRKEGKVSELLPVNCLLYNAAQSEDISDKDWDDVRKLAVESTDEDFRLLLNIDPNTLQTPAIKTPLELNRQKKLAKLIGWPVYRFAIKHARCRRSNSGTALRSEMLDASGIGELESVLHKRFFAHKSLLKITNVFKELHTINEKAQNELEKIIVKKKDEQKAGEQSLHLLAKLPSDYAETLKPAKNFIKQSMCAVSNELKQADDLKSDLIHRNGVFLNAERFENDLNHIMDLQGIDRETLKQIGLEEQDKLNILNLLGVNGLDLHDRLKLRKLERNDAICRVEDWWKTWWKAREKSEDTTSICTPILKHALTRLQQIRNYLEVNFNE